MKLLLVVVILTGCAYNNDPEMIKKQIEVMNKMRNPICKQVGSYLYCNEN